MNIFKRGGLIRTVINQTTLAELRHQRDLIEYELDHPDLAQWPLPDLRCELALFNACIVRKITIEERGRRALIASRKHGVCSSCGKRGMTLWRPHKTLPNASMRYCRYCGNTITFQRTF